LPFSQHSLEQQIQYALFRLETIAKAERDKIMLEAQASAEAIRVKGEAQAFAIEAKANAEAKQMQKKADAWKEYQEAAMVDMVLAVLPKVAAEIASPLTTANKIVMVSSGRGDVGAAKITKEVLEVVTKLPSVVNDLTGFDMTKALKNKK